MAQLKYGIQANLLTAVQFLDIFKCQILFGGLAIKAAK
jgi:hypothetical protein